MSLEEKNIPLEYYKNNQDAIRKAVYEKCSRGEITLAQREQVLSILNEYVEASETILDKFINVFENYMKDKLTDEEFDTMVESYMEEQPDLFHVLFGDDIMARSIMLKECVQMVYDEGGISRTEGKALFKRIDGISDIEFVERTKFLTDDTVLESVYDEKINPMELGDGFLTVADHIVAMEERGELSREDCHHELLRMVNEYCNTVMANTTGSNDDYLCEDAFDIATKGFIATYAVVAGTMLTLLASIIAAPFVNKAKAKKVISGYEKLMKPKVKFSDLTFKPLNLYGLSEQYLPELQSLLKRDINIVGKGFVVYFKDKPFAAIAKANRYSLTVAGDTLAANASDYRVFYKQIMNNSDINPHSDYYRTAIIMRKYGLVDAEARHFLKTVMRDLKKRLKDAETEAKKAKKEASKSTSKVTKEFAEHAEGQDLFESVEREIYDRYNRGEYTLDQREELLMEARNRYFTGE